jgi:hypothetical protein
MKIGFISMPLSGHLNPMTALARKLQSRVMKWSSLEFRIANQSFAAPA